MSKDLNPDKALIFRITHRDNVPWILDNGLHSRNSGAVDPNFVQIGNPELIDKRQNREVPIPPSGTLSDYVPFYFTPFSPMMYNIKTGYGGIRTRRNDEIVIVVTSLPQLLEEDGWQAYFRFSVEEIKSVLVSHELRPATVSHDQSRKISVSPHERALERPE